ncbi:glycosyltransferase [Ensifer sp. ENS10]|nr:glycosyltransferase [Ensifer sp. ENS10]
MCSLDVGRVGTVRSFRLDPCSNASIFDLRIRSAGSIGEVEAHLQRSESAAERASISGLPRFWLKVPRLLPKRRERLKQFSDATYGLARDLKPVPHTSSAPWLSIIVPVYNSSEAFLDQLLKSFQTQDQKGVELILSDDASTSDETRRWLERNSGQPKVRVVFNERNGGIASSTNAGLACASGEWITFLDHDDMIAPYGLKMIRRALTENPDTVFLYTDEIVIDKKLKPISAMLKPAYDPILLTGVNYINHSSVYRHDRLKELGYLRAGYDGSQDYDLVLRYLEGQAVENVLHLPYPAYWWRYIDNSYSKVHLARATDHARAAIRDHIERKGIKVEVQPALNNALHRVRFDGVGGKWPLISIIIPNKDSPALIRKVLHDVFVRTDYPDYEVIVVDNGSEDDETARIYKEFEAAHSNFRVEAFVESFNFSRSINRGLSVARGDHFLLLNNDIEVIADDWLKEMVSCLSFAAAGIVGAKLLYPNDKMQHAGVIVGLGGLAGHWYHNSPRDFGGPMNRLHVRNSLTCVTGAAMLLSGQCRSVVGAWDESHFAVAYNDVDYCLRAHKAGFRIVWTPFACMYHHESLTRGPEEGSEKQKRFNREKEYLREIHNTTDFRDPAFNPGFARDHSVPRIAIPETLPAARKWWA